MGNVTYLKFFDVGSMDKVNDLHKRRWKLKPAGETKDGDAICAVYINEGDEREIHTLHCPECWDAAVEVYHLDWDKLTCPNCRADVDLEDWFTEDEMNDVLKRLKKELAYSEKHPWNSVNEFFLEGEDDPA